jgi:hypothetical protein
VLTPPGARDRASQRPVLHHADDVEVFDRDHVEPPDKAGTGLVKEILAAVSDPGVRSSDLHPSLGAILASLLAAGKPALMPLEALLVPFPVLRMRDLLARR